MKSKINNAIEDIRCISKPQDKDQDKKSINKQNTQGGTEIYYQGINNLSEEHHLDNTEKDQHIHMAGNTFNPFATCYQFS